MASLPRHHNNEDDWIEDQLELDHNNIPAAHSTCAYISLVGALLRRLAPPPDHSGLQHIVEHWKEPDKDGVYDFEWRDDFSRDIAPKNCHSHNDYCRPVPLYNALAAGCVSVEADIWLTDGDDLLVSHSWRSSTWHRTLRSLYLDPLTNILNKRNVTAASTELKEVGIFDADPSVSTMLLIDFTNDGHKTWPILLNQLQSLRDRDWLTYYDGSALHKGPLTVVGTGKTPFDLIRQNSTNRFIFFDAPLLNLRQAIQHDELALCERRNEKSDRIVLVSAEQVDKLAEQIHAADAKGQRSRYWGEPRWPISLRDKVWFKLTELGIGMLNVDDLVSADEVELELEMVCCCRVGALWDQLKGSFV